MSSHLLKFINIFRTKNPAWSSTESYSLKSSVFSPDFKAVNVFMKREAKIPYAFCCGKTSRCTIFGSMTVYGKSENGNMVLSFNMENIKKNKCFLNEVFTIYSLAPGAVEEIADATDYDSRIELVGKYWKTMYSMKTVHSIEYLGKLQVFAEVIAVVASTEESENVLLYRNGKYESR